MRAGRGGTIAGRTGGTAGLRGLILAACLLAAPAVLTAALAQDSDDLFTGRSADVQEIPALLSADQVSYDETNKIVTASGNVEISQG